MARYHWWQSNWKHQKQINLANAIHPMHWSHLMRPWWTMSSCKSQKKAHCFSLAMSNPSQGAIFWTTWEKPSPMLELRMPTTLRKTQFPQWSCYYSSPSGGSRCQHAGQMGKLRLPALLAHTLSWIIFYYSYFSQDCVNIINPIVSYICCYAAKFLDCFLGLNLHVLLHRLLSLLLPVLGSAILPSPSERVSSTRGSMWIKIPIPKTWA